jgi:phospholipid/cholesterol/gamma-HCH transport system ATP-binding protein
MVSESSLDDVSLSIPRGKVTALMGASGGGKTTVLRLIGGQNRARKGRFCWLPLVIRVVQDVGTLNADGLSLRVAAWACCFSLVPCLPT